MKKKLVLCLAIVLCIAVVVCFALVGRDNDGDLDDVNTPVHGEQSGEVSGENENETPIIGDESGETSGEVIDEVSGETSGEEEPEVDDKPVVDDPVVDTPVEEDPVVDTPAVSGSAADMMTKLMAAAKIEVRMGMQVEIPAEMSEAWLGLKNDKFTSLVKDSIMYESAISPANESFCLIKVSDESKVEELKKEIFENCNPRKWVCMSAERVVVLNSGEYIMLAMASQDSCNSLIPAFKAEFGEAKVGTILDKTVSESIENFEDLPGGGGMAL